LRVFSCTAAKPPCKKIQLFFLARLPGANLTLGFFNTLKKEDKGWRFFNIFGGMI